MNKFDEKYWARITRLLAGPGPSEIPPGLAERAAERALRAEAKNIEPSLLYYIVQLGVRTTFASLALAGLLFITIIFYQPRKVTPLPTHTTMGQTQTGLDLLESFWQQQEATLEKESLAVIGNRVDKTKQNPRIE